MTDELWQKSACEVAEGIARRQFSCSEVMASVVARIRAKNKALNAIVFDYTEEALATYEGGTPLLSLAFPLTRDRYLFLRLHDKPDE